jgi:hypothetical protein
MRPRTSSMLAVTLSLALILGSSLQPVHAGPGEIGEWDAPINVGVIGIHAVLLPSGRVLLFEHIYEGAPGNRAKIFDPITEDVVDVSLPYQRNIFCGGHSQLPDGRLLISGGEINELPGGEIGEGTRKSTIFDWRTNNFSETPQMEFARWYPTNTTMPDGSVLVFSGRDERGQARIDEIERFSPGMADYTTLPPSASKDLGGLYPRMLVMPDGKVFQAGEDKTTRMFDPVTNSWSEVDRLLAGRRTAGGVVLLPGLRRVLNAGGAASTTAEVIDFSDPTPGWKYTGSMNKVRNHTNLVLLPDATVLAVGGGTNPLPGEPSKEAELYDPGTGAWSLMAAQTFERQYHSSALLLPDGRVLSAGDDAIPAEGNTVEIYSPPYLFKGPRPTIQSAPASIGYGSRFRVRSVDADRIGEVALIRLGATTHGFDMDQRYVDLSFGTRNGRLQVSGPVNGSIAPPGYYMLFIVSTEGVPSVAKIVLVG